MTYMSEYLYVKYKCQLNNFKNVKDLIKYIRVKEIKKNGKL